MNGSGSTNVTNYFWYQTDEPVTTIIDDSDQGAATFTFAGPAGDYNIFLYAAGSCMTDAISICPGGNANITAGGGVTYSWSDGATVLGTTPTINVTPANTTSYTCTVTNGTGCVANVNTTVVVDPLDNASFDFFDFCFGAANNAVNIATPGGTFAFNPLPGGGTTINASTGEIPMKLLEQLILFNIQLMQTALMLVLKQYL
ncbi:MAG: hypothetical protein IPO32_15605 [Crocinitomicaceae bacterium]|nr:hypothetical protein [Crocinitomicaceae bacterium]